jgi:F-type H+-transporting ATPase subunit gamma
MEDLERAKTRLNNVRTVEPILSALRTISLGTWQVALNRKETVHHYAERLTAILPVLLPHVQARARRRQGRLFSTWRARRKSNAISPERITVLVVGSERGLCGKFNTTIVEHAEQYLAEQAANGTQVELSTLGAQVSRMFQRKQQPLAWSGTLSVTALPPYRLAFDLSRDWLARYEAHELDAVALVYNAYRGMGRYEPTVTRLFPPQLSVENEPVVKKRFVFERPARAQDELWPPIIVETDPLSLYVHIVEWWAVTSLYDLLLDSAAAEHSARFKLLETATQNTERLIEELTLMVQTAKQQEITQEVQELAVGAGLIGRRLES